MIFSSWIGDFIAKICHCCTDERVSCSEMEQVVRKEGVMDYGSDESGFCSTPVVALSPLTAVGLFHRHKTCTSSFVPFLRLQAFIFLSD